MDKKKKLLEEEEPVVELKEGASRIQKAVFWIVTVVAIAGGLFHMYTGGLGSLSSMLQTVLHWLLMFILVFLLYPSKRERKWYDLVLSIAALAIGVYIVFTWQSRVNRLSPSLSIIERVFGVLLILLVLEATRRSTGKFLMITALVFLIYAKVGPWLPVREYAMSMNICPPLHAFRNAPNRTNRTINVLLILIALPNTPFSE